MESQKLILIIAFIVTIIIITWVIYKNIKWNELYPPIEQTSKTVFGTECTIVDLPQIHKFNIEKHSNNFDTIIDDKYRAFNPSLTKLGNDIIYVYRLSNATNCNNTYSLDVEYLDDTKLTKSSNNIKSFITLAIAKPWQLDKKVQTYDVITPDVTHGDCIAGFEDPRAIVTPDQSNIYIIANALSGNNCLNQMWLLKFNANQLQTSSHNSLVSKLIPSPIRLAIDFDNDRRQKNWMPFFYKDKLMFVYSVNPHVILECNTNTGKCTKVYETYNENIPDNIRGGSQLHQYNIKNKSIYIGATHIQRANHRYVTQFYMFESQPPFKVLDVSKDFVFDNENDTSKSLIQFAAGFEIINDTAYITYGEHDCQSKMCVIPMSNILASFSN